MNTASMCKGSRTIVIFAAIAAPLLALLLMGSCSSAPLPPSLGPSAPALAASLEGASTVDDDAVDRFIALFSTFEAESLRQAAHQVYAADASFNDGFVLLAGADAIADYLVRSADHVSSLRLEVQDVVHNGPELYLRWEMAYTVDGKREIVAPGVTHLRFAADGKVIYHRDYWDASGALAIFAPPLAKILAAIRNRL